MLKIYDVALEVVAELVPVIEAIKVKNRNLLRKPRAAAHGYFRVVEELSRSGNASSPTRQLQPVRPEHDSQRRGAMSRVGFPEAVTPRPGSARHSPVKGPKPPAASRLASGARTSISASSRPSRDASKTAASTSVAASELLATKSAG